MEAAHFWPAFNATNDEGEPHGRDDRGARPEPGRHVARKAGCYLYVDTKLWLEDDLVHRADGPALIFPDGVEKWYLKGKDMTRDVKMFFMENKWGLGKGLDTPEKMAAFHEKFMK
jgi:hypothetical protein